MTNRQKIEYLQQYEVLIGDARDRKLMIEYWEGKKEGLGSAPIGDGPHGGGTKTCSADSKSYSKEQIGGGWNQLEDHNTKIHALSNWGRVR